VVLYRESLTQQMTACELALRVVIRMSITASPEGAYSWYTRLT
jgi:hypothetical protein